MKHELSQQDKEYLEELAGEKILDVEEILKTFDIGNRLVGAITLLSVEQIAQALNITPETLHKWVRTNRFPEPDIRYQKRFSRWKYSTILEWIEYEVSESITRIIEPKTVNQKQPKK